MCIWHVFSSSGGNMLYVAPTLQWWFPVSKKHIKILLCLIVEIYFVPWHFSSLNHKSIEIKGKNFLHFNLNKLVLWCHQLWGQCSVSCVFCNIEMTQKYKLSGFFLFLMHLSDVYWPNVLLPSTFIYNLLNGCLCFFSFSVPFLAGRKCSLMSLVAWSFRILGSVSENGP